IPHARWPARRIVSPMTKASVLRAEEGLTRGVRGAADSRFSNVVRVFAGLFPGRRFGGGALAVFIDGRPVVDVWTGWSDRAGEQLWTADTGAMVFSATKGIAATVIHRLVDRGVLAYDEPVATYWPEFAANGKDSITVRDVLRHRAGAVAPEGRQEGRTAEPSADGGAAGHGVGRPSSRVARVPRADIRMAPVGAGSRGD